MVSRSGKCLNAHTSSVSRPAAVDIAALESYPLSSTGGSGHFDHIPNNKIGAGTIYKITDGPGSYFAVNP